MVRRSLAFLLVAALVAACVGGPAGVEAPRAAAQLEPGTAADEAAARGAALAFLRAYADPTPDGLRDLAAVVGPEWLRRWVFWVAVQIREFPGEIAGALALDSIGGSRPARAIAEDIPQRSIDLSAVVSFALQPDTGEASQLSWLFDGPILVARADRGVWLVTDVVRDGLPLSATFQPLEHPLPREQDGPLTVELDSFVAAPRWQFHLGVLQEGEADTTFLGAALIDDTGQVVQEATTSTMGEDPVIAGDATPGIVAFDPLTSAAGLTLRLRFRDRTTRVVAFELADRIVPIGG